MDTAGAKAKVKSMRESAVIDAAFADGADTSTEPINVSGASAIGFIASAAFNTKTLSIEVSDRKDGTFVAVSGATATTIATGANTLSSANLALILPYPWIRLKLNSAVTGAQTLKVLLKG